MKITTDSYSSTQQIHSGLAFKRLPSLENQIPAPQTISDEQINKMTLNEVFEFFVDQNPLAPAIITAEDYLSYGQIEASANKVARILRKKGIGPGSFVGVYFNRSERPIVSILGILKSGAAYVPIDPSYPPERIQYILNHTEISIFIKTL